MTHKYVGLFELHQLLQHHPEGLTIKELSSRMEADYKQPFSHSKVQTRLKVLTDLNLVRYELGSFNMKIWKLV